ncbi:hypothetical protein CEXT_301181 [Caerostris extrusa]|uniref:Uncharacterized protein n=1 Tax=Caerostris extrusa TaxID=172846 RepID=A0AAV4RHD1_CAEEX|nr:hypothetical protein CEXT_301181 [Caerostris extrusa]
MKKRIKPFKESYKIRLFPQYNTTKKRLDHARPVTSKKKSLKSLLAKKTTDCQVRTTDPIIPCLGSLLSPLAPIPFPGVEKKLTCLLSRCYRHASVPPPPLRSWRHVDCSSVWNRKRDPVHESKGSSYLVSHDVICAC